jgi:uncharacterized protein involved in outer membrane biogenesis
MKFRWTRWLAGAVGLVAIYTAAGFWLLPWMVRNQLPKIGQSELARQASIGDIKFNPYTLRLQAHDLRLAEADGAPLFAIGDLAVELQWKSLLRRAWHFTEIRITEPVATLAIAADGKFNLAELVATIEKRRPAERSTDSALPRLIIERFTMEKGKVDFRDQRAGYTNAFTPIDFTLTSFSTLPEQNDSHTLIAQTARGGKLRWKGEGSVNPIRASGELTLEKASLPELAVYLKSYTRATVAAGELSANVPYRLSYKDGQFEASLAGAKLSLRDLALAHQGAKDSFATLSRLDVTDVSADLKRREATVGEVRADGGSLKVRRDARGQLDVASLMIEAAGPAASPSNGPVVVVNDWKVGVKQVLFDQLALSGVDETVTPPVKLTADKVRLQLQLAAAQKGPDLQLTASNAELSLAGLALTSGSQSLAKLASAGFTEGSFDLAARRASLGRLYAQGGQMQLTRDRKGQLTVLGLLPKLPASEAAPRQASRGKPWTGTIARTELTGFSADVIDQGTAIKVHVSDLGARLDGMGTDLKQPVKFTAGLNLREGGTLSAQGSVVPVSGALQADVQVKQLALAPLQPLLAQYLKLKVAGGKASAAGRITTGEGGPKSPALRYVGGFSVAALVLNEQDGELFASWKDVGAAKLTATVNPNRLEVPELRVVEPNAKLIIEDDRSFNAARLLVHPAGIAAAAPVAAKPATAAAADPFPVRIRRVRLQNARLEFTDLSLRPQFSAKVYELNGVATGLSSNRDSRSQVELDGRVDEFGTARVRGELNPFKPSNNTDLSVVFKNVDMVPASPYSMKFAGYRVAEGKISLDLQYKVREGQLEGANQIVIDRLTLGERVESPDALKLPLQLAIAILKDSDGRINLGLPVSGNINDPQFSYGALIWKAIGNLLTKIVTAPFRALGNLLGISGEKLEAIDFDPGSARLMPPEREKLKQVAQLLGKRTQLKLSVPAQYSEAADGAALRARAVRAEITRRADVKLQAGEEPGPTDLGDRKVRSAMRDLYAERFGKGELDKQKKAAEEATAAAPASSAASGAKPASETAQQKLAIWQRVGKMIEGEPQVADASSFYRKLQERLEQNQALPPQALASLGAQRAKAILAALTEAGVDSTRAVAGASGKIDIERSKSVPIKLELASR